jgi:hypothetical protein
LFYFLKLKDGLCNAWAPNSVRKYWCSILVANFFDELIRLVRSVGVISLVVVVVVCHD